MYPSDQALSKVRDFIETRNFSTDGRIPPERTLAAELGVGRRSLRRALDVLEQEGAFTVTKAGTFIDPRRPATMSPLITAPDSIDRAETRARPGAALESVLDQTNPLEVIEVRAGDRTGDGAPRGIESIAIRNQAAANAGGQNPHGQRRGNLRACGFTVPSDHAEAARNSLFLAFFDTMRASQRDVGWRRLGENGHCYKRQSLYADFHDSIAAAIAARNGQEAFAQMQRHLSDVRLFIQEQAFPASDAAQ